MSARPSTAPRPPSAPTTAQDTATTSATHTVTDAVTDVVRWAAFSCVLVPVVLVGYGTSLAGAAGTALGLAAVTGACRVLLRRSEHGAAQPRARERTPHDGRHGGAGADDRRRGRHTGVNTPVD